MLNWSYTQVNHLCFCSCFCSCSCSCCCCFGDRFGCSRFGPSYIDLPVHSISRMEALQYMHAKALLPCLLPYRRMVPGRVPRARSGSQLALGLHGWTLLYINVWVQPTLMYTNAVPPGRWPYVSFISPGVSDPGIFCAGRESKYRAGYATIPSSHELP